MQRSGTTTATRFAFALFGLLSFATSTGAASRPTTDALEQARQRIERHDLTGALSVLEAALPGATESNRAALLDLLRTTYESAAKDAEAAGRKGEAEEYRENLAILARSPGPVKRDRPATPANSSPSIRPLPVAPPTAPRAQALPAIPTLDPAVAPARSGASGEVPPGDFVAPLPAPATPLPVVGPLPETAGAAFSPQTPGNPNPAPPNNDGSPLPRADTPTTIPMPRPRPRLEAAVATIESADTAFVARRYDEAGRMYAALDRAGKLSPHRRDHWAYCRAAEVVRRINAQPASSAEWASIDGEIEQIRRLSPSNWFAEYLRDRAAERNPAARAARAVRSNKVVVRGSSPEEETPQSAAPLQAVPQPRPAPQPQPAPTPPARPGQASTIRWGKEAVVTNNFQVTFEEGKKALAEEVAHAAEAAREAGLMRWGDPSKGLPWSPRCEIVVFPDGKAFGRETGQPPESPGFSTMGMNEGRIVFRRVNLRADHPNAVRAILPHEVTHVVLADLFPHKQIPRWADEGMAVLAEPKTEQGQRAADLEEPLAAGRLFKLTDLMVMDYPEAAHWGLYYAQSVSLTRYLVESGTPEKFVAFVQEAQRSGFDPALKQVYQISGAVDLQTRWIAYARGRVKAELTASSEKPEANVTPRR